MLRPKPCTHFPPCDLVTYVRLVWGQFPSFGLSQSWSSGKPDEHEHGKLNGNLGFIGIYRERYVDKVHLNMVIGNVAVQALTMP